MVARTRVTCSLPSRGRICPVQAAEGANAQILTWASCSPASVDTCRSSSQSTLFPRRRMTTPSDPESCTQNTFSQPHRVSACCVPGPGWVWLCLPRSWQLASSLCTCLPFHVTLTPHPSYLNTDPSIYSEAAPIICLQTCHPLSKANLKGTSPRKPPFTYYLILLLLHLFN